MLRRSGPVSPGGQFWGRNGVYGWETFVKEIGSDSWEPGAEEMDELRIVRLVS